MLKLKKQKHIHHVEHSTNRKSALVLKLYIDGVENVSVNIGRRTRGIYKDIGKIGY